MPTKEHAISYIVAGTAASSFHVPESIDWSSISAQTKNRVIVVPIPVKAPDRVEPADSIRSREQASKGGTYGAYQLLID